jgi:hypothetical protein
MTVDMTKDVTEVVTSPVTSEELDDYLRSIQEGTVQTIVTSEGKGWSFNCDGTAHYIQETDVTRREPNGRYKRVYRGKIENGHVTYKRHVSEIPCPAQYERWAKVRHVSKCKIPRGSGTDKGRPVSGKGLTPQVVIPDAGWKDAPTAYIQ